MGRKKEKKNNKASHVLGLLVLIVVLYVLSKSQLSGDAQETPPPSSAAVASYQEYAQKIFGNDSTQQDCLILLWDQESGWNPYAVENTWIHGNPPTYAYGIPQINPADFGHPVLLGDADAQIDWGHIYIDDRYGSPCAAWAYEKEFGWYL